MNNRIEDFVQIMTQLSKDSYDFLIDKYVINYYIKSRRFIPFEELYVMDWGQERLLHVKCNKCRGYHELFEIDKSIYLEFKTKR